MIQKTKSMVLKEMENEMLQWQHVSLAYYQFIISTLYMPNQWVVFFALWLATQPWDSKQLVTEVEVNSGAYLPSH